MTDTDDKHGKEMAQRVARGIDLEDWDDLAKLIREEIERHVAAKCAALRAERDELREEIQRRDQAWLAETRTNEEVVKEMTGQYVPLAIPKHMVSDDQVRTIMDDCEGEARVALSTKGDGE